MRILTTGAAGYVGTTLVPLLLEGGHEVLALDNLTYGGRGLLPCFRRPGFSLVRGDVRDLRSVSEAVEGCDAVVHLAAVVGYPACKKDEELARSVNIVGTRNVADVCGAREIPLVFPSTSSVYGKIDEVVTEDSPTNPLTLYGKTKLYAERHALRAGAVVFRPATAFGVSPRMRLDLLLNDFVRRACLEKNLVVYEGHHRRAFIHVSDFARAIVHALDRYDTMRGACYNLGSAGLNYTKAAVARFVAAAVPGGCYLHFAEYEEDQDKRDYDVCYERLQSSGFSCSVSLQRGVDELVAAMPCLEVRREFSNV